MPQEIGRNKSFRRNEKVKHQERARLQGGGEGGRPEENAFGVRFVLPEWVATIGTSERWIASRYLVHCMASR